VFAFSGYLLLQLQHLGQVAGYAWFPLGAWGIPTGDRCAQLRKLWKLVAASALIFLAGYPPLWFVFAIARVSMLSAEVGNGFQRSSRLYVLDCVGRSAVPAGLGGSRA
jgi:hypothetical protein